METAMTQFLEWLENSSNVKDDILKEDGFLDLAKGKVAAINGLDAYVIADNNTRFNYQRPKKLNTMK